MKKLSDEQKREMEHTHNFRDEDIDYSDIPEITELSGFHREPLSEYLKRRREQHAQKKKKIIGSTEVVHLIFSPCCTSARSTAKIDRTYKPEQRTALLDGAMNFLRIFRR